MVALIAGWRAQVDLVEGAEEEKSVTLGSASSQTKVWLLFVAVSDSVFPGKTRKAAESGRRVRTTSWWSPEKKEDEVRKTT